MQTLDARHIELFLSEGYRNGSWKYEVIGSHDIKKNIAGASGAIFDIKHLGKCSTSGKNIRFCGLHNLLAYPWEHYFKGCLGKGTIPKPLTYP